MRQVRTESAIFNFLNIERKGFNMLLQNAVSKKQQRMKLLLANEIYFKGLAVKVILSLKSHREDCLKQKSNEGGISYLLHCDISQFDQNPLSVTSNPFAVTTAVNGLMRGCQKGGCTAGFSATTAAPGTAMALMLSDDTQHSSYMLAPPNDQSSHNQQQVKGMLEPNSMSIDRERMVAELYGKKLLVKCFSAWSCLRHLRIE
jgi:hypothetical protein